MSSTAKRYTFLALTAVLIVTIIVVSIFVSGREIVSNPSSGVTVVTGKTASEGHIIVKDENDGEMEIPRYNIATSNYDVDNFVNTEGLVSYGSNSETGIVVHNKLGEIDWAAVKASGIDFAMIRVGRRKYGTGDLVVDPQFKTNIEGAIASGIKVGVYFDSYAISNDEADKEATLVLEQIRDYKITYPVAVKWDFVTNPEKDTIPRNRNCTPSEITSYVNSFCNKIKKSGYKAAYVANKSMGYDNLNLSQLSDYILWYSEYKDKPAFYYDYKMWQYTNQGNVDGISGENKVSMIVAMEKYK